MDKQKPSESITDQVVIAAEALTASGTKVTATAIRDHLGGGSMRDISPALRAWREKRDDRATELPAFVAEILRRAGVAVWAAADTQSRDEISAIREHAQQAAQELASERDGALAEIAQLESDLGAAKLDAAGARELSEELTAKANRSQGQVESLTAENKNLRTDRDEAKAEARKAIESAAELRGEIKALNKQLAEAVKSTKNDN